MATINGTPGNDTLLNSGEPDGDFFNGGAGDDTIVGGAGPDTLNGEAGDDTLIGDEGDDTLNGGTGADQLFGGSGSDLANQNVSNDGADRVDLGSDFDIAAISASAATNVRLTFTSAEVGNGSATDAGNQANQDGGLAVRLQAEDASGGLTGAVSRYDDEGVTFRAGAGVTFDVRDLVSGAARGDAFKYVFLGTAGSERFDLQFEANQSTYANGGGGDDLLFGTTANDFLVGGSGDDYLLGFQGSDSFIGGAGSDIFEGQAGDDVIAAFNVIADGADFGDLGDGADTVNVTAPSATNVRLTFTSAAVGNGSIFDAGTAARPENFAVRLQAESGGTPTGSLSRFDDEGITFAGGAGVTFDVRDLVSGAQRGETFEVVALGTSGTDMMLQAQPGRSYYFNAGAGDDTVMGGDGSDFLVGGSGNDGLSGGEGVNFYIGGLGDDAMVGGAGVDTIAAFNVTTDGLDIANLGGGQDIVNVSASAATNVRLSFTSAEVGNGNANDSATVFSVHDGFYAVRLQAETGGTPVGALSRFDDEGITFVGGAGVTFDVRDLVSGAQRGEAFEVVTLGTSGTDMMLQAQPGRSYYFNAGAGDDTVMGGDGSDFLVGGSGNDGLSGGEGNNFYIGGAGDDAMVGGAGVDTVAAFNVTTDGSDVANLGGGNDVVNISASVVTNVRLSFTSSEVGNGNVNDSATVFGVHDGFYAVRLQGETSGTPSGSLSRFDDEGITFVGGANVTFDVRDLVSGAQRGETFEVVALGTSGSDMMVEAQPGRSYYFNAGAGDDTVMGGDGADFLVGGSGSDGLSGGNGDDRFIGGAGADQFIGGAGADVFIFAALSDSGAGGLDRINDFSNNEGDRINLSALDADVAMAGDQAFSLVTAFTGQAAQAVLTQGNGLMTLQLDVNGDSVADFTLEIVGSVRADQSFLL